MRSNGGDLGIPGEVGRVEGEQVRDPVREHKHDYASIVTWLTDDGVLVGDGLPAVRHIGQFGEACKSAPQFLCASFNVRHSHAKSR